MQKMVFCVACEIQLDRKEATKVPRNVERRRKWAESLGETFRKNCARYQIPYICLGHFEGGKRTKKNIPRKIPPREVCHEELDHWLWGEGMVSDDSSEPAEVDSGSEGSDFQRWDHDEPMIDRMQVDGVDEVELSEKPHAYNIILCEKEKLVKLLQKCWKCESRKTEMIMTYTGLNLNVSVYCGDCQRRWSWSNTKKCEREQSGPNSKLTRIHILMTSAIVLTGNGFENVKQLFDVLESPFFSSRTFNRLKDKYVYEAINIKYREQADVVKQFLFETTDNGGKLNVMGDGSFDSPGHSALYCRYALMESVSKLIVGYEILRHKSGEKKVIMETVACERAFEQLMGTYDSAIESFTTDRSQSVALMLSKKFPDVIHFFDSWHYIRNLALEILKKKDQKRFLPLKPWIRRFVNHVYYSIQSSGGNEELAKETLLSFFLHVLDIHEDFQNCDWFEFKMVNSCEHKEYDDTNRKRPDFLDIKNPIHVKALNALLDIIEKGDRCEAIGKVSPFFATSAVESFNARAAFYASKKRFYSEKGFNSRTQLAVMDWNTKQWDELNGKRVVVSEKRFFNKTTKQWSVRKLKTPADYTFRTEIAQITVQLYEKEKIANNSDGPEEEDDESDFDEQELDDEFPEDMCEVDDIWSRLRLADSDEEEEEENEDEKEDSDDSMEEGKGMKMEEDEEEEEDHQKDSSAGDEEENENEEKKENSDDSMEEGKGMIMDEDEENNEVRMKKKNEKSER